MSYRTNAKCLNHLGNLIMNAGFKTNAEFAKAINVSPQFVGQITKNDAVKRPDIETAQTIVDVLTSKGIDCTLEDIFPRKKDESQVSA